MSVIRSQSITSRSTFLLCLMIAVSILGCDKKKPEDEAPKPITINKKSVVIHDVNALAKPFAFAKTMEQVVATAGGAPTNSVSMLGAIKQTVLKFHRILRKPAAGKVFSQSLISQF
jgi:hypothetical protein